MMKAEREIQKEIMAWLSAAGFDVNRMPLGGVRHAGFTAASPLKGFPDIFGVLRGGRLYAIEVKKPGKKPEPHQLAWLQKLHTLGAVAVLATSVDEVAENFSQKGGPLSAGWHSFI